MAQRSVGSATQYFSVDGYQNTSLQQALIPSCFGESVGAISWDKLLKEGPFFEIEEVNVFSREVATPLGGAGGLPPDESVVEKDTEGICSTALLCCMRTRTTSNGFTATDVSTDPAQAEIIRVRSEMSERPSSEGTL